MKNPLIFAGDSFTWGEGLELYDSRYESYMRTLNEEKSIKYDFAKVMDFSWEGSSPIKRLELRYSTLVSNYFNTIYFCKNNGGSNKSSLEFIQQILRRVGKNKPEHIIFQMTTTTRDMGEVIHSELNSLLNLNLENHPIFGGLKNEYENYINYSVFLSSWKEFDRIHQNSDLNYIKFADRGYHYKTQFNTRLFPLSLASKFQDYFKYADVFTNYSNNIIFKYYVKFINELENHFGKKILIIGTWDELDSKFIYNSNSEFYDFFKDRTIPLQYNEKYYNSFYEIINDNDYLLFKNTPEYAWTRNGHPNKKLHQIVANSIIDYIKTKIH